VANNSNRVTTYVGIISHLNCVHRIVGDRANAIFLTVFKQARKGHQIREGSLQQEESFLPRVTRHQEEEEEEEEEKGEEEEE